MHAQRSAAFTLVEILIVVVILGILAAIAIPTFVGATEEAKISATHSELQKIRRHIGVYRARNNNYLPAITEGDGTWGAIVGRDYLNSSPTNQWVGGDNSGVIRFGAGPDGAFTSDYAWIFDEVTGDVWAAGFDANDRPLPRP
jgi:prepilin-type N-terminal cleavage/methylation domain-containing protein